MKLSQLQEAKDTQETSGINSSKSCVDQTAQATQIGGTGAGGQCKTCLVAFETVAEYRSHYRS